MLRGGRGTDRFFLSPNKGTDTIIDFENNTDFLQLGDNLSFGQLSIIQGNNNTLVTVTQTNELLAMLNGVQASAIGVEDFVLSLR